MARTSFDVGPRIKTQRKQEEQQDIYLYATEDI